MAADKKRLRIGLVGAGRRGQVHLATLDALGDWFELAAICDVSEETGRAASEGYSPTDHQRWTRAVKLRLARPLGLLPRRGLV